MSLALPFQVINWNEIPRVEYMGEKGTAVWQTIEFNGLRVRLAEYSQGYIADHWCRKGHVVHCLEGSFETQMEGGASFLLGKGMTYIVSDDLSSHKSISTEGVKLLIIDGDFLS